VQPEHAAELRELEPAKGLGEYIDRVLVSGDMRDGNLPLVDLVTDPMVCTVDSHGPPKF